MSEVIETRFIAVSDEQADLLEGLGQELLRRGDPDGIKLLALHLAWKYADPGEHSVRVDADAHSRAVAARMVETLESERARLKLIEGGAA